ncbi:hypothetical protein E5676_scaffold477G00140 [Cucumis melo var. makuwa]|uniref:Uncharacterized protein n=1 Tax=Cucumis melo var. makuwa TaxID=1194695 RepID=A0A5D3CYF5_CUCMM|nr:hypothetical protein E6C27_scaffold795G00160 [Cucumis melo var. makuwa]TYK15446.1 hypothetical protein E5676_scaffold477G00140 [Cucumis melo var. makuwa]
MARDKMRHNANREVSPNREVKVKDGILSSTTLHRIIAVNKNKAKLKCLKTKQDGKSEVEKVEDEHEDEKQKDDVPLKRKRQGEKEAS